MKDNILELEINILYNYVLRMTIDAEASKNIITEIIRQEFNTNLDSISVSEFVANKVKIFKLVREKSQHLFKTETKNFIYTSFQNNNTQLVLVEKKLMSLDAPLKEVLILNYICMFNNQDLAQVINKSENEVAIVHDQASNHFYELEADVDSPMSKIALIPNYDIPPELSIHTMAVSAFVKGISETRVKSSLKLKIVLVLIVIFGIFYYVYKKLWVF